MVGHSAPEMGDIREPFYYVIQTKDTIPIPTRLASEAAGQDLLSKERPIFNSELLKAVYICSSSTAYRKEVYTLYILNG